MSEMYVHPEVVTRQQCSIYGFDTSKVRDQRVLRYLVEVAERQSHRFKDIFPWRNDIINGRYLVYVALSFSHLKAHPSATASLASAELEAHVSATPIPVSQLTLGFLRANPPIICGWMNCMELDTHMFISDITTRTPFRKSYGGMGYAMFSVLLKMAMQKNKEYICLYPLSEGAAAVYAKWGFVDLGFDNKMYFKLRRLPTKEEVVHVYENERGKEIFDKLMGLIGAEERKIMAKRMGPDFFDQLEVLYEEVVNERSRSSDRSRKSSSGSIRTPVVKQMAQILPEFL